MLPDNYAILVVGDPRAGMFDFCCYLAACYLRADLKVVFVESNTSLRQVRSQMAEFGAVSYKHEAQGNLVMMDCYTPTGSVIHDEHEVILGDKSNLDEILAKVNETIEGLGGAPVRVLFDSITPMFMTHEHDEVKEFFSELASVVKISGALTCTAHEGMLTPGQIGALSSAADGVLEMKADEHFRRFVRIKRMRGIDVSPNWVPFDFARVGEGQGAFLTWKRA